ncbi:MAG: M56 family metallopeptidase [Planctomycetales bacterium]
MNAELVEIGVWGASWVMTYLAHSTCLMAGAWLWLRCRPQAGHAVREGLWKTALIGGLLTTPAQWVLNVGGPLNQLQLDLTALVGSKAIDAPGGAPDASGFLSLEATAKKESLSGLGQGDASAHAREIETTLLLVLEDETAADSGQIVAEDPVRTQVREFDESINAVAEAVPSAAAPLATPAWRQRLVSGFWLLLAGLAVLCTGIGLCRCLWQSALLRRRLSGAGELTCGPARELLDELCRLIPRRGGVRLLAAPDCAEPAAFGLFHWTIVLPSRAEVDLTPDELRSLLAHELAHLVRGDNWWLLASRLICSCCGFQPLNHLARREWQRSAEYQCDAWAVNRTGSRLALARCLTEVAGWRWQRPECAASLAATGRRAGLADRIERLVQGDRLVEPWQEFRTRRLVAGLALLAGLIACGPRISVTIAGHSDVTQPETSDASLVAAARVEPALDEPLRQEAARAEVYQQSPESGLENDRARQPREPAAQPGDPRQLLAELDAELQQLAKELEELRPLLDQAEPSEAAHRLAARLMQRAGEFRRIRAHLDPAPAPARGTRHLRSTKHVSRGVRE